jgi:hypothetical protein
MSRRILITCLLAVAIGIALALPFGPLIPWSPWKPGYQHLRLARADVYWAAGTTLPAGLAEVDRDIADSEAFHRMPVTARLTVILCRNWSDFDRFLPNYRGARIGAGRVLSGDYVGLFRQVYGVSLEEAAAEFTTALRTRRWIPQP